MTIEQDREELLDLKIVDLEKLVCPNGCTAQSFTIKYYGTPEVVGKAGLKISCISCGQIIFDNEK